MKKIGWVFMVPVLIVLFVGGNVLSSIYKQAQIAEQEISSSSVSSNSESSSNSPANSSSNSASASSTSYSNTDSDEESIDPAEAISELNIDEMFTNNELTLTYDESEATSIALSGDGVTINEEGTYIISGTLSDGQIVVEVDDSEKVHLVLDGVDITNSSSAAIYIVDADKVFITLAEDSYNVLTTSGEFISTDDNDVDGVIFAKCDISFLGTGTLEINSDYGHGIVAKDDLVIMDGTYVITAASHGINANDSIRIANGDFTIVSGKDGMQADNDEDPEKGYIYIADGTFDIAAEQDGISATSMIQIDAGEINVSSGGGYVEVLNDITMGEGSGNTAQATDYLEYSMKAIKACNIVINDGTIALSSYEDALHADYTLTINGGDLYILSGDDAVHAEEILTINDGTIIVEQSYEGIEACYIYINGGYIDVYAYDDAMNATEDYGMLHITDGEIYVSCVGDGLDSNGDLTIEGGYIEIDCNPIYSGGDGDVDVSGTVVYTGGTIVDADGNAIDPTASMSSGMTGPGSSMQQMTPGRK